MIQSQSFTTFHKQTDAQPPQMTVPLLFNLLLEASFGSAVPSMFPHNILLTFTLVLVKDKLGGKTEPTPKKENKGKKKQNPHKIPKTNKQNQKPKQNQNKN